VGSDAEIKRPGSSERPTVRLGFLTVTIHFSTGDRREN
jgi:hypothetical protein